MSDRDNAGEVPVALDRYLQGDASAEERAIVEGWIAADPARQAWVDDLRSLGTAIRHASRERSAAIADAGATERALAAVKSAPVHRSATLGVPRLGPRRMVGGAARSSAAIAASVLFAVGVGVGLTVATMGRNPKAALAGREYATTAGQRVTVTLTDGTRFVLAPASRAVVAADYGRGSSGRQIELDGEAYFAVVHDATRPFAVRAHGVVAGDVGTTFDVRAYPEDAGARIAVVEGAVAVAGVEVKAGDVATAGKYGVAVEHGVDLSALTAWTQGRLAFRQAPFADVARELGRRYDVDVRAKGTALDARRVTGEFSGDSLEHVLAILAMSLDARVDRHGRTVVFTPRTDR